MSDAMYVLTATDVRSVGGQVAASRLRAETDAEPTHQDEAPHA